MKRQLLIGTTIAILLGLSTSASALQFSLESITIADFSESSTNLGLDIFTDVGTYLPYSTLDLSVGQSETFALFDIWTDESDVGTDDRIPKSISVEFSFSSPAATGETAYGETVGAGYIIQRGELTWMNDPVFSFGSGGLFTVELSDVVFNEGFFGLNENRGNGATVWATLTYNQAQDGASASNLPVPEPASMILLGIGLIGIAGLGRKKFLN